MNLQQIGEELTEEHGFLGVPANTFEESGRNQLISLLEEGLTPDSKVLDIGCGVLRVGYWLINFLKSDGYYGIEPAKERVQLGLDNLIGEELIIAKNPKFDFNDVFDTTVFDQKFDFFLAGSIWTHCSKAHIETMLNGFLSETNESAIFLVSYLPAIKPGQDYKGEAWVGTSHESNTSGCVRHSKNWIIEQCTQRGLAVEQLQGEAFDHQYWLRISRNKRVKRKRNKFKTRAIRLYENLKG